jgi:hypothetical protein
MFNSSAKPSRPSRSSARPRQRSSSVEEMPPRRSSPKPRQRSPSFEQESRRSKHRGQRSPSKELSNKRSSPGHRQRRSSGIQSRSRSPKHQQKRQRSYQSQSRSPRPRSRAEQSRPAGSSVTRSSVELQKQQQPSAPGAGWSQPGASAPRSQPSGNGGPRVVGGAYDPEDSLGEELAAAPPVSVIGMSGIAREGASFPNIHERIVDRNLQYVINPEAPTSLFPSIPAAPQSGNWSEFLERETKKEELLRQYQAGLLVPNVPSSRLPAEKFSSSSETSMAESILKLIMEKGEQNQSNIEFLRTPEMRGVLRRIFSKELADNRSMSDRGFLQSLKGEIKTDPDVVEVTLSSDDEKESKSKLLKEISEIESRAMGENSKRGTVHSSQSPSRNSEESNKHRSRSIGDATKKKKKKHQSSSSSESKSRSPDNSRKQKKKKE